MLFGAERGNLEALAAMRDNGAELLFLIPGDDWNPLMPAELTRRGFEFIKVPYIHLDSCKSRPRRLIPLLNPIRAWRANRAFRKACRSFRPTHVYTFSPIHLANFLPALTASGVPMVYRAGDEPIRHNMFWRALWRFTLKCTDRFVANSRFIVQSLERNGVARDRIHLIYNAPPRRDRDENKQARFGGMKGPVIGFVGQIAEHKGVHHLVDAFREVASDFPQARLAIVGRISEWEGDSWGRGLQDTARSDPVIGSRTDFLGYISNVPDFLQRCEFLVVPSLFNDPSPNVVVEAKQAGRAVIGYPRGGIPELIEHEVDGLICEDASVDALAKCIRQYLENPQLAETHGQAGPASLKRLGVHKFAEKWQQVFA